MDSCTRITTPMEEGLQLHFNMGTKLINQTYY